MRFFGLFFILLFPLVPPVYGEEEETYEQEIMEEEEAPPAPVRINKRKGGESSAEAKEKELKKFLDRIEPQLAQKMELHKSGQLELNPQLNQQLDEWAGKLSTYKNLSDEALAERVKRVSVMIFALYDMGEEKRKAPLKEKTPRSRPASSGRSAPASFEPAPEPSAAQTPSRVPRDPYEMGGPAPVREEEFMGVILRGTRSELRMLKRLWEKFLSAPENKKSWQRVKMHKKFKRQVLEFGVTRGKLARFHSGSGGEVLIRFNGKLLYYGGLEEKSQSDLLKAQEEVLTKAPFLD